MSDDFSSGDIAVAVEAASGSSPEPDTSTTETVASPTETPAVEDSTSGSPTPTEPKGEPPQERWADILENTRKKTRSEVEAEFRTKFGWAESVNQEQLTAWADIASRMSSDPVAFATQFITELQADPRYAGAMRSHAARVLGSRSQPQAPQEPQPDVEIVDQHGNVTGRTFSAEGLAARDAWMKQQVLSEVNQQIAPLVQDRQSRLQQEQQAQQRQALEARADALFKEAEGWRGFTENLPAIHQAMAQHPEWSLERAYLSVVQSTILPSIEGTAKKSVLADLNRKPAASTVSPGHGSTAVTLPDSDRSWEDLFAEKSRQFGLR